MDIDGLVPGKSLSLARMELVPITPDATAQLTAAIVNVDAAPATLTCPLAAAAAAQCVAFESLASYQLVAWPQTLPGRSAAILYAQNPALLDSDGDGIPDSQDLCPGTAPGSAVNASGCSFSQR